MKDLWTGELVGKMHVAEITLEDLGKEMGLSKAYISQILNGVRKPPNAKERLNAAFDAIVRKRKEGST